MDDQPIEGEIIDPGQGEDIAAPPVADDPFAAFVFPSRPFGQLLLQIRQRVSEAVGRTLTQEEFGQLLGDVDQVTVSRWQRGAQTPQVAQLQKIVDLAHEYGLRGLTLARLQDSLKRDQTEWANIDPRITELNTLLLLEDETYRTGFFNLVFALHYLLRGAIQSIRRDRR